MPNVVVVGLQWGDEGKGKVIDLLAEFADVVVRFQGGANAGHTIQFDNTKLVTNLVPAGAARPGKKVVIGNSVVLDPERLLEEISHLQAAGFLLDPERILISDRAHVVMPYHRLLDEAREASRGKGKIGTTLRGIGPCLEDKAARMGIRTGDLLDSKTLEDKIQPRLQEINALLKLYGRPEVNLKDMLPGLVATAEKLKPFITDVGEVVRGEMERGKNILFEAAQGAMLDIDHGTYPFVTSSNTIAASACASLGVSPQKIDAVIGVCKAYTTRVGEGPFPTELRDERGERLRQVGSEYGATTGRPRRCGWLDLVALKYAVALNGASSLCLTKLDVLSSLEKLALCTGYKLADKKIKTPPANAASYLQVEAELEEMDGWKGQKPPLSDARELESLPKEARRYIDKIVGTLAIPLAMISVGPRRSETILLQNPFRR